MDEFADSDGCPDPDNDQDGVPDVSDKAPNEPEDKDGFADGDGVPDPDNDGDQIADLDDKCPDVAEVVNGFEDGDGCPDEIPDYDGDGLIGAADKCPNDAEDMDSFQDSDGCPDPDNDGDSVLDSEDSCPAKPGPVANKGCPDPDRDSDTVPDRLDNCPDEPGTVEHRGCKAQQHVEIRPPYIYSIGKVHFATSKDLIQKRSHPILDNVAAVLLAHPEVGKIRVEGHTDSRGRAAYNRDLSQRRAQAVAKYLIKKGVDASRLAAKGYGPDQPIADNETEEGREKNRRVEFRMIE
jgi:outer membrane protein OmpA-like peptidoglycan-associated protein